MEKLQAMDPLGAVHAATAEERPELLRWMLSRICLPEAPYDAAKAQEVWRKLEKQDVLRPECYEWLLLESVQILKRADIGVKQRVAYCAKAFRRICEEGEKGVTYAILRQWRELQRSNTTTSDLAPISQGKGRRIPENTLDADE